MQSKLNFTIIYCRKLFKMKYNDIVIPIFQDSTNIKHKKEQIARTVPKFNRNTGETNTLDTLESHTAQLTLLTWYRQYIYIY